MDNAEQQIVERLKEATNVLVTTSSNPTVDQLAAVIGLTLLLNKADKHATAVFSGEVPSTLEFLQPEKTLEKNTDSLRDFIISLDKSKADKLRYKVEDSHVKIFITPYRTSITDKDLEFSQGDFNVDLVILLGVHEQKDLDQAITAHGRILHDATVSSIAHTPGNNLGTINWVDTTASSLCEMLVSLVEQVKPDGLDGQISTALMTGIVAETARFSNEKTTATTMATSARLMATGANQQLVATELQPKPEPVAPAPMSEPPAPAAPLAATLPPAPEKTDDGALKVEHAQEEKPAPPAPVELPEPEEQEEEKLEQIHIDEDGSLHPIAEMSAEEEAAPAPQPQLEPTSQHEATTEVSNTLLTTPPMLGGTLAGNSESEGEGGSTDPLSLPPIGGRLLSHDAPLGGAPAEAPEQPTEGPVPARTEVAHGRVTIQPPKHDEQEENVFNALDAEIEANKEDEKLANATVPGQTLSQIETQVSALPGDVATPQHVSEDQARDAVSNAMAGTPQPLTPPAAFNAQPLDMDVQGRDNAPSTGFPPNLVPPMPTPPADNTASPVVNPMAPPPLPPPMMPPMPGFTQPPTGDQSGNGTTNPQEPPK